MLPYKNQAGLGLGLCHLVLVALGASYVDLSGLGSVGRILEYYGELSGAGNGYGFFAPGISGQLRVRFDSYDSEGRRSPLVVASPLTTHEANLRMGNIIDQFPVEDLGEGESQPLPEESSEDGAVAKKVVLATQLKRSLAASLALHIFKSHPEVKQLAVYLEEFSPVSMEEYRDGILSEWRTLYQAKFRGL